jgi:hypothetical protein
MAYANWGSFILRKTEPFFEVAVLGNNANEMISEMKKTFCPNVLWAFSKSESKIPILANRYFDEKSLIYVCREGVCQLPVDSPFKALEIIKHAEVK